MRRGTLLCAVFLSGCHRSGGSGPAAPAATPPPFPERAAVLEAVEGERPAEARKLLQGAPDTADVHYLQAKVAEAASDPDGAYREMRRAVASAPDWAEYQFELGMVAPMPVAGLGDAAAQSRLLEGGRALARACELRPDEPRYLYARAYFLSIANTDAGGDPKEGEALFQRLVERFPDSAFAHRVRFDRAARAERWDEAETEAGRAGAFDPLEGSRLFLQVAATRLRDAKLERAQADLESAARLKPSAAGGFCDAGYALDGGGNAKLALPFWRRCLELLPDGARANQARARLGG